MLMIMFKMMKKGNKGFTLVELMVVVVIIGVLTAIAVPVYNNVTEKARINAIAANLRIINGAISQYQTNNSGASPTFTLNETTGVVSTELVPKYLQAWPTNPGSCAYSLVTATATVPCEAQVLLDKEITGLEGKGPHKISAILSVVKED